MSDELGNELPLPFDATLFLPFQLAWRATSPHLSPTTRARSASRQLSSWGFQLSADEVLSAYETLGEALRLDEAFPPPRPHTRPPRQGMLRLRWPFVARRL